MHWTPIDIARKAGEFLAVPNTRVLDIGSGVGKFCIVAGFFYPETTFYGVEQREELFSHAGTAKEKFDLPNVRFIHRNLTELNTADYDHFYYFNPFYENIEPSRRIDYTVEASSKLYDYYSWFVYKMLDKKPSGTRLVTFHGSDSRVPLSYRLVDDSYNVLLKMWVRK
jgi:hypothetical protein